MDFFTLQTILVITPILLIALPTHELAHAWVAYKLGDNTAKDKGRLTLNPFKHLDLMGSILIFVAGFGWAKPVPVNAQNFKDPRKGMFLVSVAGPLSNILLAFIGTLIGGILSKLLEIGIIPLSSQVAVPIMFYIMLFLYMLVFVNLNLAIFNLLPIPPLDGSKVLSAFVPEESYERFASFEPFIGLAFLAFIVLFPNNFLGSFIQAVTDPLRNSMIFVIESIFGINAENPFWLIMQGQV